MDKSTRNALFLIGGLVIGYYVLKGRALANMIFSAGQVQGITMDGATPIITFSVIAQNTNAIGVNIQSIAGNVYAQDAGQTVLIGNIASFQPVHIPGNGQVPIVFQVRCAIIGIVNEIISAFQNRNQSRVVNINAIANVDGIQIPIPEFQIPVGI